MYLFITFARLKNGGIYAVLCVINTQYIPIAKIPPYSI